MRRGGFTLVELLVVVTLVGILSSIGTRSWQDLSDRARGSRAAAEIRALERVIQSFQAKEHRYPVTLAEAGAGVPLDPWGRPYVYQPLTGAGATAQARKDRFLVPLNSDFDLYSKGKDGDSQSPLTATVSRDDIIRANDGGFVGRAEEY